MNMRTPHIVPLAHQAVDALRYLHELRNRSPMVVPGERDHERPMSTNTLLKALERIGYMTPQAVHYGHAQALSEVRQATLDAAFQCSPNCFEGRRPSPAALPTAACINPPASETAAQKTNAASTVIS